jgi:hypothetical protein
LRINERLFLIVIAPMWQEWPGITRPFACLTCAIPERLQRIDAS